MATAGEGSVKIGHDFLMSVIQLLENPSQISVQGHTGQPMMTISGTQPVPMTMKAEKPKKENLLIFTKNKSPVTKQNPLDKKAVIQKRPSLLIPHNRVRMIMKTAPNTTLLSQETIALASKAAVSKTTRMQWCGNSEPTGGHFNLFSTLFSCFPYIYTLYTTQF